MPFCCKTVFQINTHLSALFGKESCQRQLTERLKNILFIYDVRLQVRLKIRLSYQGQSLRFSYEKPPPFTKGRRLSAVKQQKQGRPCFKFYYMYITGKRFRPQPFWQPSQKACPKHRKTRCKPFPAAFSKKWFGFGLRIYFSAGTLSFYS